MNFLDEMERLAKAATPGPWVAIEIAGYWDIQEAAHEGYDGTDVLNDDHPRKVENAAHIAAWSPDRALKVVEALRAAEGVDHAAMCAIEAIRCVDDNATEKRWRSASILEDQRLTLRAALAALEEPR